MPNPSYDTLPELLAAQFGGEPQEADSMEDVSKEVAPKLN